MLAELPDAVSPVLWQDVRHVRDWAETDRDVRLVIFSPASRAAVALRAEARISVPELADALTTFAALKARPADFDEDASPQHAMQWWSGRYAMTTSKPQLNGRKLLLPWRRPIRS